MRIPVKALLGLAVFGGTIALYTYLKTGVGAQKSPFLPDVVEDKIDALVGWLNKKYGRRWVQRGLSTLQHAVEVGMPGLAGVLNAVFAAEQATRGQRATSQEKRQNARDRMARA